VASLSDDFAVWELHSPPHLFGDPIWRLPAFRLSLFLAETAAVDAERLRQNRGGSHVGPQLERSIDSIGANIAEGYSRFSGRERARFYEIALGSAREAREWYRRATSMLGDEEVLERARLLTRVIKILVSAIPQERAGASEKRLVRARTHAKKVNGTEE